MIADNYPKAISVSEVFEVSYELSSAYVLKIQSSKYFLFNKKENTFKHKFIITKNNFLITHSFITYNAEKRDELWGELLIALKTNHFSEQMAESLGFIKEGVKL